MYQIIWIWKQSNVHNKGKIILDSTWDISIHVMCRWAQQYICKLRGGYKAQFSQTCTLESLYKIWDVGFIFYLKTILQNHSYGLYLLFHLGKNNVRFNSWICIRWSHISPISGSKLSDFDIAMSSSSSSL